MSTKSDENDVEAEAMVRKDPEVTGKRLVKPTQKVRDGGGAVDDEGGSSEGEDAKEKKTQLRFDNTRKKMLLEEVNSKVHVLCL